MSRLGEKLLRSLADHAERFYGASWVVDAWLEFSLNDEAVLDGDQMPDEFDTIFGTWCLYHWTSDGVGFDPEFRHPQMPVALHYLEHRRDRLDTFTRHFIEAICAQPLSFFIVRAVRPRGSVTLRDLLSRREFNIHEPLLARELPPGSIVYAQVVTLDGDSVLLGWAPYGIPASYAELLIDLREEWGVQPENANAVLADRAAELRGHYWAIREALLDPEPEAFENTDGDPTELTLLQYRLTCTPQEASDVLRPLARGLGDDRARRTDASGALVSTSLPWANEEGTAQEGWLNVNLGEIRIDGPRLEVFVNSARRAEAFRHEAETHLGDGAVFQHAIGLSDEEALDWWSEGLQDGDDAGEPLRTEAARKHWEQWLDEPLPELKNQTPREAARTDIGRERLEAVLWHLDDVDAGTPLDADTARLRRALDID